MAQPVQFQPPVSAFAAAPQVQEDGYPPASEEDSPLFHSDDFRIWCMKVIPCTKRFVHDWTVCPFAHAGEKAVRRDPRTHNYTGIACPDMKKQSSCIRGEKCPYAHNVFEYWLHPTRYRTQLCNDGPTCKRSICFFAHSLEELRVPAVKPYVSPEALARASLEAIQQNPHPLGQQLPNPAAAMRAASGALPQQQAMQQAASGGGGGGTPRANSATMPPPYSPHAGQRGGQGGFSGYAPAAAQQAPGGPYGMPPPQQFGGPPQQYGAPPPQQYGAPPQQQYGAPPQQQYAAPPQQAHRVGSAQRMASAEFNRRMSMDAMKLSLTPNAPQWGHETLGGGYPASPGAAHHGGWNPDMASSSLPNSMGAGSYHGASPSAAAAAAAAGGLGSTGSNSCRPSYDLNAPASSAGGSCRPSFDVRASFDGRSSYEASAAAAAAQQQQQLTAAAAAQQLSTLAAVGRQSSNSLQGGQGLGAGNGSHNSLAGLEQVVRNSRGSDNSDRAAHSPTSDTPTAAAAAAASALPAATELDLAQSLATLKIALTQQHVAAAAGSNHEIVISTLHQILKEAIAQHGGKLPNLGSLPGISPRTSNNATGVSAGAGASGSASGSPGLAASSSFFAASDNSASAASASPPPGGVRLSSGGSQHGAAQQAQQAAAAQQQPWISTMGNIKWDAAPAPASPNSVGVAGAAAAGTHGDRRLSGESAGTQE